MTVRQRREQQKLNEWDAHTEKDGVGDRQRKKELKRMYSRAGKKKRTIRFYAENPHAALCIAAKRKFIMILEKCKSASAT